MSSQMTILVENTKPEQSKLDIEHGLSIYVQTSHSEFIFDCGHTGLAWSNANKLNVDLSKVKSVILSHSHYDHAGGFPALLQYVTPKTLYTGNNFWTEKYSHDLSNTNYKYRGCGFTRNNLDEWNVKQKICHDSILIDDEAWLVGNFIKKYPFETIPQKFVCGIDKRQDNFVDEICLVIRENYGVAVITGCAHNGILNIVATVKRRLNYPVHSVIGGIHLKGADNNRIDSTLTELKNLGVQRLLLCHCSGDEVFKRLQSYDIFNAKISTGNVIDI